MGVSVKVEKNEILREIRTQEMDSLLQRGKLLLTKKTLKDALQQR